MSLLDVMANRACMVLSVVGLVWVLSSMLL